MSKGCIILKKGVETKRTQFLKNGEIEDAFSESRQPLLFSSFCLYRVRSDKKDSKKFVSCRYYKRVPKQLHLFHLKFSEYTNAQIVRLLFRLSIINDENPIRKRALWAKMKNWILRSKMHGLPSQPNAV